jgi:hypothetical protein
MSLTPLFLYTPCYLRKGRFLHGLIVCSGYYLLT